MEVSRIKERSRTFSTLAPALQLKIGDLLTLVAAGAVNEPLDLTTVCQTTHCTGAPANAFLRVLCELGVVQTTRKGDGWIISNPQLAEQLANDGSSYAAVPPVESVTPSTETPATATTPREDATPEIPAAVQPHQSSANGALCEACQQRPKDKAEGSQLCHHCRTRGGYYQWRLLRRHQLTEEQLTEAAYLRSRNGRKNGHDRQARVAAAPEVNYQKLADGVGQIASFFGSASDKGRLLDQAAQQLRAAAGVQEKLASAQQRIAELEDSAGRWALERRHLQENDVLWRHVEHLARTRKVPTQG